MRVLILSEHDVRELLDMESCIAAMEDILSQLARDELHNPLRFVMRPPGPALMGLMPAYRGGDTPSFALKEIVIAPENSARGLDPHQGAVLLHDGVTGELIAMLNASPVTEIRTAAVTAAATKALARKDARAVAVLGSGVQGRSHVEAMQTVIDDPIIRIWSRNPAHAEALALETHSLVAASIEDALVGADIVCTATAAREPIVELDRLAPGTHVNAVGASVPTSRARLGGRRRGDALRRPARVDAERVRRLPVCGRRAGHWARSHRGRARRRPRRKAPGTPRRRRADALQVARHRRRGSRGCGAVRRTSA